MAMDSQKVLVRYTNLIGLSLMDCSKLDFLKVKPLLSIIINGDTKEICIKGKQKGKDS